MSSNLEIRALNGERGLSDADIRHSAEEMDEIRQKNIAYQYLCHLEEAKKWLEACLKEELPPTTELEEHLRNGVYLAKIGHFISPEAVCLSKIYDLEQRRYRVSGLQFRHTDNISYWLKSLSAVGLPQTFHPETTDVYDKKNMPRVIYCLHALSTHLFKLGKAPLMQDLYGQVDFTDDEINAVCKELEKYGIQMPPFQKIGGILTNDLNGDKAQLHAAVIAINEAIDRQDCNEMVKTLLNPIVDLKYVDANLSAKYQDILYEAKRNKTTAAHNKSLSESYISDAYDELLTIGEIQGHISSVNFICNWNKMIESAEKRQYKLFKHLLLSPFLQIKGIRDACIPQYCENFCKKMNTINANNNIFMSEGRFLLQEVVDECNNVNTLKEAKDHAVALVNNSLDCGDCWDTLKALKNRDLQLQGIDDFAAPLYYEEMRNDRADCGANIGLSEIQACVRVLSLVANITKMVNAKNVNDTWIALSHPDLHIKDLEPSMKNQYWKALYECSQLKMSSNASCPLLTYMDVQDCVYMVNLPYEENRLKIDILNKINAAITSNDQAGLLVALRCPSMEAKEIEDTLAPLYMKLLKEEVNSKNLNEDRELWLDDVFRVINSAHSESKEARKVFDVLKIINFNLMGNRWDQCFSEVTTFPLKEKIHDNLKPIYFRRLQEYKHKRENQYQNPWITHCTSEGNMAFINLENGEIVWEPPKDFKYGSSFLNLKEVKHVIAYVNKKYVSSEEDECQVAVLIRFQAHARGFLLRQKQIEEQLERFKNNYAARKIQNWWRNAYQRKLHWTKSIKKMESDKLSLKEKEKMAVKIQAAWRGHQARQAFRSLVYQPNPSLTVVRYFAPLLAWNREDYRKEIELQTLKGQLVQNIRHSQLLSQQLDSMDIKIGLLVQNRITLQDVVAHGTTLNDLAKGSKKRDGNNKNVMEAVCGSSATFKGLKSLTKDSRKLLDGYQNLFYLLQTRPCYLSKLIFCLPQSKTTRFLQTVILTLYNFGSNTREEYLLLRLFQSALEEEVKWKIQKISDTVTGNPLVLKLVIRYARQHSGQNCLHTIVGPLVEKILNNKSLVIDTNPVEIYKSWINQMETETGKPSGLAYTVTQEKALTFEEVQKRLNEGIKNLKESTLMFLNHILESKSQLPYGLLYIAKVLKKSLAAKFPHAPEKDLLKVIGNFIYYQFINSAIVAPDAFDIITLPADRSLSNDCRRNLASIAKILQFAASKKGFGEESKHLTCLNPFIIECHEKFKKFFRQCCEVEEPEDHFSIHEFSEATLISRPVIYITFQEICDTHSLLLEYQEQIAPDPMDPIHEILEDLGSKPCISELVGEGATAANTTFYLTLTNKFEVPEDDATDANKIFIQAKELLVMALPYLAGSNLSEALITPSTSLQSKRFEEFQRFRLKQQQNESNIMSSSFCVDKIGFSLEECKLQIRRYLAKLELEGFVSQDDHYQTILTAIARDICNRRKYRQIRLKELQTLRATKNSLDLKIQFFEEQVDYYNQYIKKCLENLNAGKRSVHCLKGSNKHPGKIKSSTGVKYTADKLSAKGIILEIEGLPRSQFKNVLFEILPTEVNGVFEVKGKFMGVEMEKIEIDIQNLLQLQFEGVSIMDIFGKAKLNINLLLFLLNKKFYGKT